MGSKTAPSLIVNNVKPNIEGKSKRDTRTWTEFMGGDVRAEIA